MSKLKNISKIENRLSALGLGLGWLVTLTLNPKSCDLNLKIKVQVLLDIEKTITEGNVGSEILEVKGLILIEWIGKTIIYKNPKP
jgi:hypothetical protein